MKEGASRRCPKMAFSFGNRSNNPLSLAAPRCRNPASPPEIEASVRSDGGMSDERGWMVVRNVIPNGNTVQLSLV